MLKLILIDAQPGESHTTFRVDDDAVEIIGRKAPRLRTSDTRVSREHAEVRVQNGVWVIRDLGSANGTLVNNRVISGLCELEEDDTIQVGRVKMIVAVARIETAAAHPIADAGPDDTAAGNAILGDAASDDDTGFGEVLDPVVVQDEQPPSTRPETPDELPVDPPSLDEVALADVPPTQPSDEAQDAEALEVAAASEHADDEVADHADHEVFDDNAAQDEAVISDNTPAEETSEPVDPEPASGLRLANYDVLDDDELAEALAAEAPPAVPVAGTPVQIEFPDKPDVAHADDELLLDVDSQANIDFDADAHTPEHPVVAGDYQPPVEAPAELDPFDAPRPAPASADSHLITPAPDSALGAYHQDHGFPWRGTAAAVLTLAAVGVGGWLLSQGALSGALTPVTGPSADPETTPDTATALAPVPVASAPTRPRIPRSQPSPFDAGPLLTAPITPRSKPIPARTPAPETLPTPQAEAPAPPQNQPQPKPRPTTPAPAIAPVPQPQPTPAPAVAVTPPPVVAREAPAPAIAIATPELVASDTPAEQTAADPTPTPAVEPAAALVPPALADPTPQPTATLLPDIVRDTVPEAQPDQPAAAAAPPLAPPLTAPRRVVYVVDASGSMVDSMNQGVLTWLETQVGSLRPDDTFTVMFFRDDEVLETPPAGLKPGRRAQQAKALDWMAPESGNMRPRGRSRPLAALRLAASYQASEIVLLTDDNFGLRSGEDVSPDALTQMLRPTGPDAAMPTVHAVQFFYEDTTGRLKDIANAFGGRYEFVEEPPFDARPVLDDLLGG